MEAEPPTGGGQMPPHAPLMPPLCATSEMEWLNMPIVDSGSIVDRLKRKLELEPPEE